MKKHIFVLLMTLIVGALTSCKKYEEGPSISFRSKTQRVVNEWKIKEKFLNGVQQTLNDDDYRFRLTFKEDGSAIRTTTNGSTSVSRIGNWEFINDEEQIRLLFIYTFFASTITEEIIYTIIRLKENELWVQETMSNGDILEYRFESA